MSVSLFPIPSVYSLCLFYFFPSPHVFIAVLLLNLSLFSPLLYHRYHLTRFYLLSSLSPFLSPRFAFNFILSFVHFPFYFIRSFHILFSFLIPHPCCSLPLPYFIISIPIPFVLSSSSPTLFLFISLYFFTSSFLSFFHLFSCSIRCFLVIFLFFCSSNPSLAPFLSIFFPHSSYSLLDSSCFIRLLFPSSPALFPALYPSPCLARSHFLSFLSSTLPFLSLVTPPPPGPSSTVREALSP